MPLITFACPACRKVLKSATAIPAGRQSPSIRVTIETNP